MSYRVGDSISVFVAMDEVVGDRSVFADAVEAVKRYAKCRYVRATVVEVEVEEEGGQRVRVEWEGALWPQDAGEFGWRWYEVGTDVCEKPAIEQLGDLV